MKTRQPTRPTLRVLVHGGAGPRRSSQVQHACLAEALILGGEVIQQGQTALDAVEIMIQHLESSGLFNAGLGSRSQLDGVQRMDASIMEGTQLKAGGVAGLERIQNPIRAARVVMEQTDHVLIIGKQALNLAKHFGLSEMTNTREHRRESLTKEEAIRNKKP